MVFKSGYTFRGYFLQQNHGGLSYCKKPLQSGDKGDNNSDSTLHRLKKWKYYPLQF